MRAGRDWERDSNEGEEGEEDAVEGIDFHERVGRLGEEEGSDPGRGGGEPFWEREEEEVNALEEDEERGHERLEMTRSEEEEEDERVLRLEEEGKEEGIR